MKTVLKDWKAMVHHPSYNQRTSLADAVLPVLGKKVAAPILTSKYTPSMQLNEYIQFHLTAKKACLRL